MDKKYKKIHIIGFPKCGSTSLRNYLKDRFTHIDIHNIASFPGMSLYHPDWITVCGGRCSQPDTLSIIITRDPYERIWSAYFWSQKWNKRDTIHPTFEEFLHWKPDEKDGLYLTSGLFDPIECCDYAKYIKKAVKFNPIIIRFEDMIKNPNFPNHAKTNDVLKDHSSNANITYKPEKLDDYNRALIKEELNKAGIPDYN